jgi:hypothetical protein
MDHRGVIYRRTEATDNPLGAAANTYAVLATRRFALAPAPTPATLQDAGMQERGPQTAYFRPNVPLQREDVIHVTGGPMAGVLYRVTNVPQQLRGHFAELAMGRATRVILEPWSGTVSDLVAA